MPLQRVSASSLVAKLWAPVKISILFDQPISNSLNILQHDHCSVDDDPVGDDDHHGHVDRPVDDYPAGDDDYNLLYDHQQDRDDLTGIKDQQLRILGVHLCCCSVCSKRSASAHRPHFPVLFLSFLGFVS